MSYYFYLLRCKDGSLYSGVTTDLKNRELLHNSGKGSKYVRSRGGGKIIYSERFIKIAKALARERAVKKWPKPRKEQLVLAKPSRPR